MNTLAIKSTYFPSEPLPINRWFRFLCNRDLDLSVIDTTTLIGSVIVQAYQDNPDATCKMILEMYRDNPSLVEKVIGTDNLKKLK